MGTSRRDKKRGSEVRVTSHGAEAPGERDPITGLGARKLARRRLTSMLRHHRKAHPDPLGVILIDIDDFSRLNEGLGEQIGDRLLRGVAKRIVGSLEQHGEAFRYGDDRFLVLLPGADASLSKNAARSMIEAIEGVPIAAGLSLTASAGVSVYPGNGATTQFLLGAATDSLHRARRDSTKVGQTSREHGGGEGIRSAVEFAEIKRAIDEGGVIPYFQPIVDLRSRRPVSIEALARLRIGNQILEPSAFMP